MRKSGKFKFPSFSQWKQIFKVLKKGEKKAFLIFFILAISSLGYLSYNFYISSTKTAPASGGVFAEGVVGQPRFINPIYGETNDVDRTLIGLVFSGLMAYGKNGKITTDLADNYKVSEDGKTYDFTLKNNLFWHDGKPLTADDVLFTIKIIQNSDYKSPLRANWIDVAAEKISEKSFVLKLKSPYNSFLENCTIKIIPQHIWENISPENFALSSYNLQPIGSGPFEFQDIKQTNTGFIKTIKLSSNRRYYGKVPFVSNLSFEFFEKKEDLIKSAKAGSIDAFSLASLDNNELEAEKELAQSWPKGTDFAVYSFSLPRYFAVFFNQQKNKILSDANIRQALNYAVDKKDLALQVNSAAKISYSIIESPILPDFYGYEPPGKVYEFDQEQAKKLLDKSGFKENGIGARQKSNKKTPAFQFKSYLAQGSKGNEVTQLQSCMARLGFSKEMEGETNGTYGKPTENAVTEFQKKYLPNEKPTGETGKKTRDKLNELCITASPDSQSLQFTLVTINQPQLKKAAEILKDYWRKVGAAIDIKAVDVSELKSIIKERSYDAILYGEALGSEPDLYPFWHSSQVNDPGLNLSSYEDKDADTLLKDARETLDQKKKQADYEKLQDILIADAPALFLYNPDYVYWVSKEVKGIDAQKIIDPAKRFSNIENWHIKTKRTWK